MKKFLFNYILPPILSNLIKLWGKTLRIECLHPEIEEQLRRLHTPHILTGWHQHIFLIFYYFRGWKEVTALISPSTDGDLLAGMCRWMGYNVVRGSSYKQPIASSRVLVKALRQNLKVGIVADGSRGPYHVAQTGTLHLARLTGTPYSTCSWDARWKYQFNSWDRFLLPLPFSRCRVGFGPLFTIPRDADEATLEAKRQELEDTLNHLQEQVALR
jgi:lysophospholipid acyltransferase (LPLAT)-like uncharacterized protein